MHIIKPLPGAAMEARTPEAPCGKTFPRELCVHNTRRHRKAKIHMRTEIQYLLITDLTEFLLFNTSLEEEKPNLTLFLSPPLDIIVLTLEIDYASSV